MDQSAPCLTAPHSHVPISIKALKAIICGSITASHNLTVSPSAASFLTVTHSQIQGSSSFLKDNLYCQVGAAGLIKRPRSLQLSQITSAGTERGAIFLPLVFAVPTNYSEAKVNYL